MQDVKWRLQKYLSQAGFASRRKAEELIEQGRVTVNGVPVTKAGTKVTPGRSRVAVDGTPVFWKPERIYLLLNKPSGYITSLDDPEQRPVVTDLLPKRMPRVFPVGRLDWESEGALLMTNDGELAHRLMHPSFKTPRVYAVKVRGEVKDDGPIVEALTRGVRLEDGMVRPDRVTVHAHTGKHTWIEIALHIGRKRVIRRMCEAVGHEVLRLRRLSYGELTIKGLASGQHRDLTEEEVRGLYEATGADMRQRPPLRTRASTKRGKGRPKGLAQGRRESQEPMGYPGRPNKKRR